MVTWLERYEAGQHSAVWTEMLHQGDRINDSSELLTEAMAVVEETLARSVRNIERLIDGLPDLGYVFEPGEGLEVRAAPTATDAACLDSIESLVGPLPMALRAWLLNVGEVNLMGRHASWTPNGTHSENDPLVVQCPPAFIFLEMEDWELERGTIHDRGPFRVSVSPDVLHKAQISGGPPYEMLVPNDSVDGLLLGQRSQTTFINHVRQCFAGGGFAAWRDGPPSELVRLIASLESI